MFPNLIQNKNFSTNWLGQLEKIALNVPKCDVKELSYDTDNFQAINGLTPPGNLLPVQDSQVLLDIVNDQGQRVLMTKGVRKAGTRIGIHVHSYGGYTIILSGEMTDFVEGIPNKTYGPNSAYYMPPCTPMSAANLGTEDVELIDVFIGPPGKAYIEILEPNWTFNRIGRFKGINEDDPTL